ncbi:MAG: serine--tRNA ligase, partial [Rheinheimera sp.]|nr:serine--tRNA ligase [Rheinheimera sp.]
MLDPKFLRTELNDTATRLASRGFKLDTDKFSALEEQRRVLQVQTQELQNQRNSKSKGIGQAKARGEDIGPLLQEVDGLGAELDAAKAKLDAVLAEVEQLSLTIPNLPDASVPVGKDETENQLIRQHGEPRQFD